MIESAQMEQGRSLIELTKRKNSKLDLASYGPTKEREEAIPIRIPVLSGLMGYRLCLIDEKKQKLFDGIENKQQLLAKKITIGQHQNWPDTTILRANNISVQTTHKKNFSFNNLLEVDLTVSAAAQVKFLPSIWHIAHKVLPLKKIY